MSFAFNIPFRVEKPSKTPYIETLGSVESYWAATAADLGLVTGVSLPFCWEGTFQLVEAGAKTPTAIFSKMSSLSFGLTRYPTSSGDHIALYPKVGLVNNGFAIPDDETFERHTFKSYIEDGKFKCVLDGGMPVDNAAVLACSIGYPDSPFAIGVRFTKAMTLADTPDYPCRCRVWNWKMWQDNELKCDLIPFKHGGLIGLKNNVSGDFFPANNCIYGEE